MVKSVRVAQNNLTRKYQVNNFLQTTSVDEDRNVIKEGFKVSFNPLNPESD